MKLEDMVRKKTLKMPEEDYVLVEYDLYFDDCIGDYNNFSLDDENEINLLKKVLQKFMIDDNEAELYVCAYSHEITDYLQKKSMYADTIWIKTRKSIDEVERIFEECKTFEPSDVSVLENNAYFDQRDFYLYKKSGDIIRLNVMENLQECNNIKVVYWN